MKDVQEVATASTAGNITQQDVREWYCGIFACPGCNMITPKGFTWCSHCGVTFIYNMDEAKAMATGVAMAVPSAPVGSTAESKFTLLSQDNIDSICNKFSSVLVDKKTRKDFSLDVWRDVRSKLSWRGRWDGFTPQKRQEYASKGICRWYPRQGLFPPFQVSFSAPQGSPHTSEDPDGVEYASRYRAGMDLEHEQGVVGPCLWPWLIGNLADQLEPVVTESLGRMPNKPGDLPFNTWKKQEDVCEIIQRTLKQYDPDGTNNVRFLPGRKSREEILADMHRVVNAIAMNQEWGKQMFAEWLKKESDLAEAQADSQRDVYQKYVAGEASSSSEVVPPKPMPKSAKNKPKSALKPASSKASQPGAVAKPPSMAAPSAPPQRVTRSSEGAGSSRREDSRQRKKAKGGTPSPTVPKQTASVPAAPAIVRSSSARDIRGDTVPRVTVGGSPTVPASGGTQSGWNPTLSAAAKAASTGAVDRSRTPVQRTPPKPAQPTVPPPAQQGGWGERGGQAHGNQPWVEWFWRYDRIPDNAAFHGTPPAYCDQHYYHEWRPDICPTCRHITFWHQQNDIARRRAAGWGHW